MGFETTLLLLTWVAILLLGLVVSGLVRRLHAMTSAPATARQTVAVGAQAPGRRRITTEGQTTVLLFVDSDCASCTRVLGEARSLAQTLPGETAINVLFRGAGDGRRDLRTFEGEAAMFEEYKVPAVPFAVVVNATGVVVDAQPLGSPQALRTLVGVAEHAS